MGIDINASLSSLRKETSSDLTAFAYVDHGKRQIHWKYISGNTNNRYKKMVAKPGVDVSGMVVRAGHLIVIDDTSTNIEKERLEFPIMLAEDLYSAIGVPVIVDDNIRAVLLIGNRTRETFPEKQIQYLSDNAQKLSSLLKANTFC